MSSVNGKSFEGYLLNNEQWLTSDKEEKGTHAKDGKLDSNEISTFFSGAHLEVDRFEPSGDAKISSNEFNEWFNQNQSSIKAYFGADVTDADVKNYMLEFLDTHADAFITTQENIEKLGEINVDELKPEEPSNNDRSITDAQAREYASKLWNAIDFPKYEFNSKSSKNLFSNIMNNENLTNSDWLKIIDAYDAHTNKNNGKKTNGLVYTIENAFKDESGKEKQYLEKLSGILLEEAEKGTENAMDLLCKEFHGAVFSTGEHGEAFVTNIMENASNKVLSQLISLYENMYKKYDIYDDIDKIKELSDSVRQSYKDRLAEALSESTIDMSA